VAIEARHWRIAGGVAVLAALALFAVRLVPVYLKNFELQQFLEETAQRKATIETLDDLIRVQVVNEAARLGLPVRADQVRVRRTPGKIRIEVLYIVPVDLPLYTVDLHFRPAADGG
jgi:hypothetical protein